MTPYGNFLPFLRESNLIEGITSEPGWDEALAFAVFYREPISFSSVVEYQKTLAPGFGLRLEVEEVLREILNAIGLTAVDPYQTHCEFMALCPFNAGNGRTSRALWARHTRGLGRDPFIRPFLHTFYYQALAAADGRK